MISSTELIRQWEEKELPMLREKDFRGDAKRMAYTAFVDGFAFGVNASKYFNEPTDMEWFKRDFKTYMESQL